MLLEPLVSQGTGGFYWERKRPFPFFGFLLKYTGKTMKRTFGLVVLSAVFAVWMGCSDETKHVTIGGMNGDGCTSNEECQSQNCDGGICYAPGDSASSGKIPNGDACTSDDQCISGNCYEGKVCRTPNWGGGGKPSAGLGDDCTKDSECKTGNCKDGHCLESGESSGSDKIPNGDACTSDDQCISGNCYEGKVCRTPNWGGGGDPSDSSGSEPAGSVCTLNAQCKSKICVGGKCADRDSTGIGDNGSGLGHSAVDQSCSENRDCESGLCVDGKCSNACALLGCREAYTVCRHDKCIPVSTIGQECSTSGDCAVGKTCCNGFCSSNSCEVGISCEKEFGSCINSCRMRTSWGDVCGCSVHEECGENYFCDNQYGNGFDATYLCVKQKSKGGKCRVDEQCLSQFYCDGYSCQIRLELDEQCLNHRMCKSGACYKGDQPYNESRPYDKDGICVEAQPAGVSCDEDGNCQSGRCVAGVCK